MARFLSCSQADSGSPAIRGRSLTNLGFLVALSLLIVARWAKTQTFKLLPRFTQLLLYHLVMPLVSPRYPTTSEESTGKESSFT